MDIQEEDGEDDWSKYGSSSAGKDEFNEWAVQAFADLCGNLATGSLLASRIRDRVCTAWFRALINDMIGQHRLRPAQMPKTMRLISLLAAKADLNEQSSLSCEEFVACTRVLTSPSAGSPVEAEFVWALFDLARSGSVSATDFPIMVQVLASAIGVTKETLADDQIREGVLADAAAEGGLLTAGRFLDWYTSHVAAVSQGKKKPKKKTAEEDPARPGSLLSTTNPTTVQQADSMTFAPRQKYSNQLLRSKELCETALWKNNGDRPLDLSEEVRCLTPSCRTARKKPGRVEKGTKEIGEENSSSSSSLVNNADATSVSGGSKTPRFPALPVTRSSQESLQTSPSKELNYDELSELWEIREKRLRPHQRVKASYTKPDGTKGEGVGTLISGWGRPSRERIGKEQAPHSVAPETGQLRRPRDPIPSWTAHERRARDKDQFAVVELHDGVQRLVPADCITPLL